MTTFRLYHEFGAQNSPPVFAAFRQGALHSGNKIVDANEDVAVIWSVLWHGRMQQNQHIYHSRRQKNLPTIIIEVGNLVRNTTWRIGINNVNGLGEFGNSNNLDAARPNKLGINIAPWKPHRRNEILIAGQHEASLQWEGQASMQQWVSRTVAELKKYTDRPIKFRPHPRARYGTSYRVTGVDIEIPKAVPGTYDSFDFDHNYHCVVSHNAGAGIQSVINGCPVVCDYSSLAYPVSEKIENIESPVLLPREDWFLKLCHTEWTVGEISRGVPLMRLIPLLNC